ncbi:MAG: MFS transporter [Pseudomonadota bacterium]
MTLRTPTQTPYLRYALFGSALAFAGPPVYIHIPKLYTEYHGMGLATIGAALLVLRSIDFIQDPALGYLIAKFRKHLKIIAFALGLLLSVGMLMLFSPTLPIGSQAWLFLSLICVFTGFSGLQILYYSTGVSLGKPSAENSQNGSSHTQIASWREAGVLFGICAACVTPTFLSSFMTDLSAYFIYSLFFVFFLIISLFFMNTIWAIEAKTSNNDLKYRNLIQDAVLSRLLIIGFVNTLPVGLTSTLFLFFVEDRLGASTQEAGVMLLLFFLCAAIAAPFWGMLAKSYGLKNILLFGMALSIAAFSIAFALTPENYILFYGVCALSGFALGADMTLLPAMLSQRLEKIGAGSAQTFGLWGFVNKATLALAAAIALPLLQLSGFEPSQNNSDAALVTLSFMYAALPCLLKVLAIFALILTKINMEENKC